MVSSPDCEVDVVVPLPRAVDAVGPVQPGVEPLRRVRRAHLRREHVAHLVVVGAGVGLGGEVAALPAPVGPGAGQPVEDLPGARSRRRSARSPAARRASPRRRPSATGTPARPSRATRFSAAGTPALRKYFCASTSEATWLQPSGTSRFSRLNTTEPSGLRISEVVGAEAERPVGPGFLGGEAALDLHRRFPLFVRWRALVGKHHILRHCLAGPLEKRRSPASCNRFLRTRPHIL